MIARNSTGHRATVKAGMLAWHLWLACGLAGLLALAAMPSMLAAQKPPGPEGQPEASAAFTPDQEGRIQDGVQIPSIAPIEPAKFYLFADDTTRVFLSDLEDEIVFSTDEPQEYRVPLAILQDKVRESIVLPHDRVSFEDPPTQIITCLDGKCVALFSVVVETDLGSHTQVWAVSFFYANAEGSMKATQIPSLTHESILPKMNPSSCHLAGETLLVQADWFQAGGRRAVDPTVILQVDLVDGSVVSGLVVDGPVHFSGDMAYVILADSVFRAKLDAPLRLVVGGLVPRLKDARENDEFPRNELFLRTHVFSNGDSEESEPVVVWVAQRDEQCLLVVASTVGFVEIQLPAALAEMNMFNTRAYDYHEGVAIVGLNQFLYRINLREGTWELLDTPRPYKSRVAYSALAGQVRDMIDGSD